MKLDMMLCWSSVAALSLSLALPHTRASSSEPSTEESEGKVVVSGGSEEAPAVDNPRLAKLLKQASFASGVNDVAEMAEQGIDESVLSAHVLNSEATQRLRAEDIAHLRKYGVPDDIVGLMIERRAENRERQAREASEAKASAPAQQANQAPTVTIVPGPSRLTSPASTVTVIGRSDLDRGLSYRRYYYSPRNYYSPRRTGSIYGSFGNYKSYGRYGVRFGYRSGICW